MYGVYIFTWSKQTLVLMYKFHLLVLVFLLPILVKAQTPTTQLPPYKTDPKREFRGVWIATVENLDWPVNPTMPSEKQKQQLAMFKQENRLNFDYDKINTSLIVI